MSELKGTVLISKISRNVFIPVSQKKPLGKLPHEKLPSFSIFQFLSLKLFIELASAAYLGPC